MTVLEFVVFSCSESFLASPSILNEGIAGLLATTGCNGVYSGVQVEDNRKGYLIIGIQNEQPYTLSPAILVWETYEDHERLTKSPDYPKLVANIQKAIDLTLPVQFQHVPVGEAEYIGALGAPRTEVVVAAVKDKDQMETALLRFEEIVKGVNGAPGAWPPAVFAVSREKSDTIVGFFGWDTVEAHMDTVANAPFAGMIEAFSMLADIDVKHAPLVLNSR